MKINYLAATGIAVVALGAGSAFGARADQPTAASSAADRAVARELKTIRRDLRAIAKDVRDVEGTLGPDVMRDDDDSVIGRLTRVEGIAHHACYSVASTTTRDEFC